MVSPVAYRKRKMNKKGRNEPTFSRLPHWVQDSAAFRSLKPGPRALLIEMIRKYNGRNNGQIIMSARQACEAINIADKDTALRYLNQLRDVGLIRPIKVGGFNMKDATASRATEWALTWERVNEQLPTREFMDWKPS